MKKEEPTDKKDDKTSLLNKDEKKEEAKTGAPEKYEAWKLPEGFQFAEGKAEKIEAAFKELGISQDAGQKLVDMYVEEISAIANAGAEAYMNLRKEWVDAVKADPEIGKSLPQVKANIARALDGLGQPEAVTAFKEAMDLTGAGDHPAFIKVFNWLAQKAVEGRQISGKGPSPEGQKGPNAKPASPAQAMYPNLPSANQS